MYTLKDNGVLQEIICGNNFEYILENNLHFEETVYKVLLSQTNGIFIQCMKMMRNGKLSLYYLTDDYRPMSSMFMGITPDILISVVVNLFADIIEVRNNGFLACQSIDLSWDKIFVEQSTLKVKLVYLPVSVKTFDSYAEFESELRASIVKLIQKVIAVPTGQMEQFVLDLSNGSLSIEDVYNKSRGSHMPRIDATHIASVSLPPNAGNGIKLVAMNTPQRFELVIGRDEMLLGKKPEWVDGVISFNKMISRKHCKITRINGNFYISDEGSVNGTYVNNKRVEPGQSCQIKRGDIVRLADSDFQIV